MPKILSESQKFDFRKEVTDYATSLGFDLVGFSPARIEEKYLRAFEEWIESGNQADMDYMKKIEQRRDINLLLPGAKTVIVFGLNYYHEQPPLPLGHGRIARYAYGRDYHKVIGKKLKKMEKFICARAQILPQEMAQESHFVPGGTIPKYMIPATPQPFAPEHTTSATSSLLTKSYVDTGPLMERALAEQAGIGRIGKNGCLITEKFGSWVFLSEIITTIDLNFSTTHHSSTPDLPLDNTFPGTESQSADHFLGSPANLDSHSVKVPPGKLLKSARADFSAEKTAQVSHLDSGDHPHGGLSRWSQTPPTRWSSPFQKSFNICGNCTRCITSCPTGAIIAPGIIDSRLCISYLTIENCKKIPPKLAKIIKKNKRLFGCDICQEVCPHNKARAQASASAVPERIARGTRTAKNKSFAKQNTISQDDKRENLIPTLDGLLTPIAGDSLNIRKLLKKSSRKNSSISPTGQISQPTQILPPLSSDASFLRTFAGSPLMRAKRRGLTRTAKIF